MKPLAQTPTKPLHYALLSASYTALAGRVALRAVKGRRGPTPVEPTELVIYGLATAGLARLLAKEKVTEWIRRPFVDEPVEGERTPRGRGPRYVLGELLTCTRCLGSWSALTLVGLRTVAPAPAQMAATLLAFSYVNNLLQAGLTAVQAQASHEEALAAEVTGATSGAALHREERASSPRSMAARSLRERLGAHPDARIAAFTATRRRRS